MAQQSKEGAKAKPVKHDPQPTPVDKANDERYNHPKNWIVGRAPQSRTLPSLALALTRTPFAV